MADAKVEEEGEGDESIIEVAPPDFPWQTFATDEDEARRAFVMQSVPFDASTEPKFIIDTWKQSEHWLKTGEAMTPIDGKSQPVMPGRKPRG